MNSSDTRQKRKHSRKDFYRQIEGVALGFTFYASIQNLSLGGMCFETDYLFRSGLDLYLMFKLCDTEQQPIKVEAEVVWVEPLHMLFSRVGVSFKELDPKAKRVIKKYISGLTIKSEEGVSGITKYPLLFSSFKLSNLTLKNRLTMAPMFWGYAEEDGAVSELLINRYREIALGGVGMIVVANAVIDGSGVMASRVLRIDQDRFIPGLAKLAKEIKSSGAVACLQINHAGRWAKVDKPLAPSPVTMRVSSDLNILDGICMALSDRYQMRLMNTFLLALMRCRQSMTIEEIQFIEASYGQAALRAQKAGFDMIELHGATGYLLAQFLSPRFNHRSDSYGGSLENRMRFPLEVVQTVKKSVGNDYPVGYRFLANEWLHDGFDVTEAKIFAKNLEKLGIAYLSVTAGTHESFFLPYIMNQSRKEGYTALLARQIMEAVSSTPVISTGRIVRPALAEKILINNEAHLIGLARTLFADPLWPNKVLEGRETDIALCRCCNTCLLCVIKDEPVVCGMWDKFKKIEMDIELTQKRKKWEKILIAVDDSENSLEAVEYAGSMIGRGKKVTLFNVLDTESEIDIAKKKMQDLLAQAKIRLQDAGISEDDIEIRVAIKKKSVSEDILEEVNKGEYGSIIVGKKSVARSNRLSFGSIPNHIVRHAKDCGVWVID